MKDWDASFGPSYTPMEMLDEGIFEGIYTHAIEGIPAKYKSHKNVIGDKGPDVEINKFKVKSRQSLKEWQKKKWTTKLSPLGWWEWYIKYFEGRRDEKEDKLQISRWNSYVARHQGQIKANCKLGDLNCRPKQRQGLLQWGWDSTTAYTDDQVAENAKRLSRLSGNSKLATESFSSLSPDLIRLGVSAGELLHNEIKKNKGKREKTKTPSGMKFTPTLNPAAYLPFVSVKEEKGYVTVSGFSMKKFAGSVTSLLGTARFKNMFHSTNARGFVIESFFVIEILKVTDLLLSGKSRTNGKILKSIRDGLLKNTWVAKANVAEVKDFKYDNLKRLNINLLPKQRQFLEEYAELVPRLGLKGWLLAAAPGTGKTITGYAWHMVQDFDVLIVIAPNNTIEDVWEKTFYRFFNKIPKYWLSRPNFRIKGDEEFIITHYEHLEKTISELHRFKGKRIGLWVDESHNFNELTSNRTNHLIDMAKEYVDEAVLASGTPLKALGKELVPLFRITDELFTPSVEEKFIKTFGSTKGAVLELLNYRMDRVSFKVHKSEVVNNVVTEVSHGIKIPNGGKYTLSNVAGEIRAYVNERLSHYTAIKEEIIEGYFDYINKYKSLETDMSGFDEYIRTARKLHTSFNQYTDGDLIKLCSRYERDKILPLLEPTERKSFKQIAARYKYPLLVVRGEALGRILTRRRIECMVDMVPYADLEVMVDRAKKKTVIFTNYVEIVNAIADHLKTMGHKPIIVHGETTDQLTNNLKRFLEDPTANPIVTTYKSLSTGTPLISASTIVLYDSPFRNYIIEQTISRADRLDQDSDIEVVRPYLDTGDQDNLSTRSIELAALSKEMVDAILKLDKVDTRLLSVESYSGQRLLSREYYSSGDLVVEKVKCDKELYYVDIYPNPPSKLTLNPTYPQGSKFAKDNHLPDHWVYDAAVERVELHSSIIGALRAKYSEWKELIEKHGTDGLQFNIYKCNNSDKVEWLNPTSLINYRYDYDAHFTDAWWGFGSVDLELLQADGRVTADKNGRRTPKGSYWFHCDDSTPFALIQVYGDEHVIEHSPIDLEVIGNLYSEEVEVTGATKSGRALSTESYHELEKDKGSPHSVVYRRNDTELYHISFQPLGKLLKPRLPAGSELMDSESTHWSKEPDIPRICFSETIEGCVRAIYPNISKLAEEYDELEFYLYKVPANSSGLWVPPWALCEDGMVWDATLTKEWWSLSNVKIRESGKVSFKFNTDGKWLNFTTPTGKKVEHSPMEIEITQVGGGYGR